MRLLIATVLLSLTGMTQAEIVVVAGKDSRIDQLDERQVANLFLAKTNRLDDGSRVKLFELSDNRYRESFYKEIAGKSLPQIKSYWTTFIFTGKGRPPKTVDQARELIELLNKDPDAIGYMPLNQADGAVKVLYVLRYADSAR